MLRFLNLMRAAYLMGNMSNNDTDDLLDGLESDDDLDEFLDSLNQDDDDLDEFLDSL